MTILMGSHWIFTIIYVNYSNPIQAYQIIELAKNPIQVIHNIISCIVNMTGIHTNSQAFIVLHFIDNSSNFFKTATYLRTFTSHRL
ncbi:hypothetical protein D3C77_739400 [compost metagenome]